MTPKPELENLLPEPVRPEAWECCGSDCGDACIQTIYWKEKAAYDAQQKQRQAQPSEEAAVFSDGLGAEGPSESVKP